MHLALAAVQVASLALLLVRSLGCECCWTLSTLTGAFCAGAAAASVCLRRIRLRAALGGHGAGRLLIGQPLRSASFEALRRLR